MTDRALSFDDTGQPNPWSYEQIELGFNYRMNEMEAALGLSQLSKLDRFIERRLELSRLYDQRLESLTPVVQPISAAPGHRPSLHLHTVRIDFAAVGASRGDVMRRLAERGVGSQVHYIPLHRQPYFRRRYGEQTFPGAESYYAQVLALPLFPRMSDGDVDRVVEALQAALG